ncbi:MAG: ABC transporter substrate-binding protein [Thermomicrobiales bacterium]
MEHEGSPSRFTPNRRSLLMSAAAAGAAFFLPGPGRSGLAREGENLIFLTWGGDFGAGVRTAFSDPFTAETGATIQDVTPFNFGKFLTAMQNGNPEGYDLIWFDDDSEPFRAGEAGFLEELNYDLIPNAKQAIDSVTQPYAVSPYVTAYQAAYRTEDYGDNPPGSWADFWDVEKFPGSRSLGTWVGGVLEAALLADGVEPDKLYPLDEERAFSKLDELKPNIRVFHDTQSSEQVQQMLTQGEISMVLTWATDFIRMHLAGEPVNVIYNQGFYFSPAVGIAKGTEYLELAHGYMNMLLDADAQRRFVKAWLTSPSNVEAADALSDEQRASVVAGNVDKMVALDPKYYADNLERIQELYDAWRVG